MRLFGTNVDAPKIIEANNLT